MADELEKQRAKAVYELFCNALKEDDWSFEPMDEKLSIYLQVPDKNLSMDLGIIVEEERQSVTVMSQLPFEVIEDRQVEMALAICIANNRSHLGHFEYHISEGDVMFRLTHSFDRCFPTKELAVTLVGKTRSVIAHYYDRLRALGTGVIDLERFAELENEDE